MPFHSILGHDGVVSRLSLAVARDTLPPSLLFAGPDGVGKRTTAIALAEVLNCERPQKPSADAREAIDACGVCAPCRRIAAGSFSELLVLAPPPGGSIKIEQVRDTLGRMAFRPFEGRRRAVVVDDAETLTGDAQGAMLKTLEEPNPSSVMVLISARPELLLPTVRSRCPQLRFGPLGAASLEAVLAAEGVNDPDERRRLAAAGRGSAARALAEREGSPGESRRIAEHVIERIGAMGNPGACLDLGRVLLEPGQARPAAGAGSAAARERHTLGERLAAIGALLRDVALVAAGADRGLLVQPGGAARLERIARVFDKDRLATAFAAVDRARFALDRNASPKIVADWVVLQL